MKTPIKRLLCLLLCLALTVPAWAADGGALPCAGAPARLTREQAAAYARRIRETKQRAQKEWNENSSADSYLVCATLVGAGEETLLWLADYELTVGVEPEWPGELAYRGGCLRIAFEELWQWDGSQVVPFAPMNAVGAHFALREGGVEAFSVYLGTDVDGDAWDAFYPFADGKLSQAPAWCRCWCCAYDYRLDEAGISAEGLEPDELARAFVEYQMTSGGWPQLPFDWDTFGVPGEEIWDMARYFSLSGGSGWKAFYGDGGGFPDVSGAANAVPGATLTAAAMTFADDETWQDAEALAGELDARAGVESGVAGFRDVPADAYFAEAVAWAVKSGVTNGTAADTFSPQATCTRAQVATFLWRMAGMPEPSTTVSPFRDVKPEDYFCKAVLWAVERGITFGTSDAEFSPGAPCTRAHVITFLWRYLYEPKATRFSQLAASLPRDWYTDAAAWADSRGILDGTAEAFTPHADCPRADIVLYLYRCARL